MNFHEDNRQKEINDIIAIVKVASLLLCILIFFSKLISVLDINSNLNDNYFSLYAACFLTVSIILVYLLWSFFTVKIYKFRYIKTILIFESSIFMLIYSLLIFFTNVYSSNLKFLFLFVIITTTIQIGESYGIGIAIVSSFIILSADIYFARNLVINSFFENDLILSGVFILSAWTLGHYVKIERENMARKNIQLETMDKELKEHTKQREYMEEILLKDDACYNLLIENSDGAIMVHRDGKLIFGNESAAKLIGFYDAEKLIEKEIFDFTPQEDREYLKEKLQVIYDEKKSLLVFEQKIMQHNGNIVIVQNTSTFFVYEGRPAILTILHDITSEKQVQKLQKDVEVSNELLRETREFNKLITEFFSNISHELKTPLNVIFSAVQLLNLYKTNKYENYEGAQEKYLDVMKQNCYRLMRLINNLLDITRFDSGFLKLNLGNYNIVGVVEDMVMSVAAYAESKGISIVFDTDTEERIIAIDPDKMERIILNLLSNSIKFTNYGGSIFVSMEDKKEYVSISIKDTGIGIPEEKLNVIFDRFVQVDKTLKREHEGSGIGLSLVKSFVEMHKGAVNIKSKLGEGSEFIVILPVNTLDDEKIENNMDYESNIERINIEFSDIYSQFTV